jgi:hypothetical protein
LLKEWIYLRENGVAGTCKGVAVIFGILGGLGSFVIAWRLSEAGASFFVTLITYLFGVFISALVLFAIGEIIDLLSTLSYNQRELLEIECIAD